MMKIMWGKGVAAGAWDQRHTRVGTENVQDTRPQTSIINTNLDTCSTTMHDATPKKRGRCQMSSRQVSLLEGREIR